eukprot:gene36897-biopygen34312
MIYRIRQYRPSVDTFILLADEVVRMEKLIMKRFDGIEDITSVLREALLNQCIMIRPPFSTDPAVEDSVLKVALAVSCQEASPTGGSVSNRPVMPIILPAALDYKEVVSKIWAPSIINKRGASQKQLSRDESFKLELVASTVNNIPRLAEYANTYFVNYGCENVNGTLISYLMGNVSLFIRGLGHFPSNLVLRGIIFDTEIPLSDPGLKEAIAYSIITNSLPVFDERASLNSLETNIFMLQKAASASTSEIAKSVHKGLTNILESLQNVNKKNLGNVREILVYNWLKIRLDVAGDTM